MSTVLSSPQLATLTTELAKAAYTGKTDAQVSVLVNAPSLVANPVSQPQIPVTMAESALATLLNDQANESLTKLLNWVNFGLVKADIDSNNRVGVGLWGPKLQLLGIVTAGESTAIQAYAASTVADPSWPAQVPGPSVKETLFGAATWTQGDGSVVDYIPLADINAARGGA